MLSLCLQFPLTSQNMQSGGRLDGCTKLPVGVNVSVDECLSLSQPCDELMTGPACTLPSPQDAAIGLF